MTLQYFVNIEPLPNLMFKSILQLLQRVNLEIGEDVKDEELRMNRFRELRSQKDKLKKRSKLKRELENEMDKENDIVKSGKVVVYLSYSLIIMFICMFIFILKDLDVTKKKKKKVV